MGKIIQKLKRKRDEGDERLAAVTDGEEKLVEYNERKKYDEIKAKYR